MIIINVPQSLKQKSFTCRQLSIHPSIFLVLSKWMCMSSHSFSDTQTKSEGVLNKLNKTKFRVLVWLELTPQVGGCVAG